MTLSPKTKIDEVLSKYPFVKDYLISRHEHFKTLDNPIMRRTLGKVATLGRVAMVGGFPVDELLADLARLIKEKTGEDTAVEAPEPLTRELRIEAMKGIIRDLHAGADPLILKERFHDIIKGVTAAEISSMEQALIAEGMPETEVKRLCDVHVEVFRESLEGQVAPGLPAGHPVHTHMRENRAAEDLAAKTEAALDQPAVDWKAVDGLLDKLSAINVHYARKENQLFPLLEAKGISGPSKVMWALHDDIRAMLKDARALVSEDPKDYKKAAMAVRAFIKMLRDMIYKEEHILFPMALETLGDEDWARAASGEAEIGYAWVKPEAGWAPAPEAEKAQAASGTLNLDTGTLSPEIVNLILTHLPVDISFVNERDEVMYYSATEDRIFPRSPGVIGRTVQNCHPQKSVESVNRILDAFKKGERDSAEFWIQLGERFVHIRYFAVRDRKGAYRGCLEVSQDVTAIRKLQGQKRLLE